MIHYLWIDLHQEINGVKVVSVFSYGNSWYMSSGPSISIQVRQISCRPFEKKKIHVKWLECTLKRIDLGGDTSWAYPWGEVPGLERGPAQGFQWSPDPRVFRSNQEAGWNVLLSFLFHFTKQIILFFSLLIWFSLVCRILIQISYVQVQRRSSVHTLGSLFHDHLFSILFIFTGIFLVNYILLSSAADESSDTLVMNFQDAMEVMHQVCISSFCLFVKSWHLLVFLIIAKKKYHEFSMLHFFYDLLVWICNCLKLLNYEYDVYLPSTS